MKPIVLVVDDDPVQRRLLEAAVAKMGHQVATVSDGKSALEWLEENRKTPPAAMILDLVMPGLDGLGVMAAMSERGFAVPVIVQTAQGGVDVAVSAMRAGAFDFCVKPASRERLGRTLADALKVTASQEQLDRKPARNKKTEAPAFIGASEAVKRVLGLVTKAAASDIPVLIEGESGTGKELIARAVQAQSARASKPLIIVNCGAIPDNLVESILFGHEKGAFTGATEKHVGKFVEADGGTLFLDEIGDLPLEAQVKVLWAIQDGEVEPVGARQSRKVDVRLISATNRDLIAAVREGRFREDLYYRLNVFPLMVPPLRYRKEDIPALAQHFMKTFDDKASFPAQAITDRALALLAAHDWPGNVRQLQNAVFRALVLSETTEIDQNHFPQIDAAVNGITIADVPPASPDYTDKDNQLARAEQNSEADSQPDDTVWVKAQNEDGHMRPLNAVEGELIAKAITHYDARMSEVARRLGIGRSTLYRKLKEHDIEPGELV